MNLYFSWSPPLSDLLTANLVPFATFYRPLGSLYYRLIYGLVGWTPIVFRCVTIALLLVNLLLVFRLARRFGRSSEIGFVAALLYTFHGHLRGIYVNNGTIYDVLCATVTITTLLTYARFREHGRPLKWWQSGIMLGLFIAAVNAKEMAAILPGLIFAYEWIYHPPDRLVTAVLSRWLFSNGRTATLMAFLAVLAFWGKQRVGSALDNPPFYTTQFTFHQFVSHEQKLLSELFYKDRLLGPGAVVTFYLALFITAAVLRRKELWFFAWFSLLAPLPVVFIPYRGFFVMYLPLVGLVSFAAVLIVCGRDAILRVGKTRILAYEWRMDQIATAAILFVLIPLGRNKNAETMLRSDDPSLTYIKKTVDDILKLNEPLPPHPKILLLRCRYPEDAWGPQMIMQILYDDRDLAVDRPAMIKRSITDEMLKEYDRVIDFDGSNLITTHSALRPSAGAIVPPMKYPQKLGLRRGR